MKKSFYLLILMMVFIPLNVFGAEASFSLDCPSSAKKGESITCTVKADVTVTGEEKLTDVTGTIDLGDKLTGQTSFTKASLDLGAGTGLKVGEFSATVKSDVTGNATVSFTVTSASDTNGSITVSSTPITKTIKVKSSDASISSIKIDGKESSCNLNNTSCTLPEVKKGTISVATTTTDSNATVAGDGNKTLKCGSNTIKLDITAEDGTKKDYTMTVNRSCNKDVTLKGITLSTGELNPTFSATTKEYTVDVTSDIDKITIAATKNDATQTVTGTVKNATLAYGPNKFNIVVKSEDGNSSTYTILVNRKDDRDTNNYLESIEVSDGKIKFDKEITEYEIKVLSTVEKFSIEALPESEKAKVTIKNNDLTLKEGLNTAILISVKSETGEERIYKVVVNKLKEGETLGDNPNLSSIKVNGYDLGFDPNKIEYTLKIENEDKLDITYTVEEEGTEVVIAGNDELKDGDVIKITSTSLDGTVKEYKIVIEKSNKMIFIIIAGAVGVLAIGGIIFLLIKNKKDKNKFGNIDLKNQIKKEDMLNKEVKQEELKPVHSFGPTTPVSPVGIKTNETTNMSGMNNEKSYNMNVNQTPSQPQPTQRPVINNAYRNSYQEQVKPTSHQEVTPASPIEQTEATRVCSICGHRVSASLKTCPYCKRSF